MTEQNHDLHNTTPVVSSFMQLLPPDRSINQPEEIDRPIVQIFPDGRIAFKGTRARIEELLRACAQEGLVLRIESIFFCGELPGK